MTSRDRGGHGQPLVGRRNLNNQNQQQGGPHGQGQGAVILPGQGQTTCLELALEGERLCKTGDFKSGVAFLEASVQAGTEDLKTLSAIYSQLGNAYFYLGDYSKALYFHRSDLTLARTIGDRLGEAKASGNLGNTLKVLGKFEEAVLFCNKHYEITLELEDKTGQARALYNLANTFHSKGKHLSRLTFSSTSSSSGSSSAACGDQQNFSCDPGEFPHEIKECLMKALEYYLSNLELNSQLDDKIGQGRACGNLGNVYYLLGDFEKAIEYHGKRLELAKVFNDVNAMRRAYTNLGNAHVFRGDFEIATEMYKKSLQMSVELNDKAVEAQACYSLGNTFTLLRDYEKAIEYHMRHLQIAVMLQDRIGEGRAYWSLGNAYSARGEPKEALKYAMKHFDVAKEMDDSIGQTTALTNVSDLKKVLGLDGGAAILQSTSSSGKIRRKSMDEMKLIKINTPPQSKMGKINESESTGDPVDDSNIGTPSRQFRSHSIPASAAASKMAKHHASDNSGDNSGDSEDFFNLLSKVQANRLDDQRCSIEVKLGNGQGNGQDQQMPPPPPPPQPKAPLTKPIITSGGHLKINPESNINITAKVCPGGIAAERMDDDLIEMIIGLQSQRLDGQRARLPSTDLEDQENINMNEEREQDEDFFENLVTSQIKTRIEDQRSTMTTDDDFFSLIARIQGKGRMEDQRVELPSSSTASTTTSSTTTNKK